MPTRQDLIFLSRRDLLRLGGMAGGGVLVAHISPFVEAVAGQQAAAADPAAQARAQMGAAPLQSSPLGNRLVLLSGPGGNVVALHGPDGKVLVDGFVQPAWKALKAALDGLDAGPLKMLIDTHWHFDHADNNANFRAGGGAVVAHANTGTRLAQPHDLLGMHFPAQPAEMLPTETFTDTHAIKVNGEDLALSYIPPAHTDTDIVIHFRGANVMHLGDLFFNGIYPFIDASTGGNIDGMIAAATRALGMADGQTKIVPGHGPLGDKAALANYRDVLQTVRDRVHKLKTSGATLEAVVKAAPGAEFDGTWGQGFLKPNDFIGLVYSTLRP